MDIHGSSPQAPADLRHADIQRPSPQAPVVLRGADIQRPSPQAPVVLRGDDIQRPSPQAPVVTVLRGADIPRPSPQAPVDSLSESESLAAKRRTQPRRLRGSGPRGWHSPSPICPGTGRGTLPRPRPRFVQNRPRARGTLPGSAPCSDSESRRAAGGGEKLKLDSESDSARRGPHSS